MTSKDKFLQIRISEGDKQRLTRLAKESGLTVTDLIELKIQKMLENFDNGIIQEDIQAKAFDKVKMRRNILKLKLRRDAIIKKAGD